MPKTCDICEHAPSIYGGRQCRTCTDLLTTNAGSFAGSFAGTLTYEEIKRVSLYRQLLTSAAESATMDVCPTRS
jgi:hypothetical protein